MTRRKPQTERSASLRALSLAPGFVLSIVLLASLITAGCTASANDDARSIIESAPVRVEAEQVMLAPAEVDCGVRAELWGPPTEPNQGRSICPLMDAGRALHFDDDVVFTEPGYQSSYVQVRGTFPLTALDIVSVKEGRESNTKLIESKVGVRVANACFPNPLPIMGAHRGQFSQDHAPVMMFRFDDAWKLENFVH